MSAGTLFPTLPPVVPAVPVRRFTVDEYHQMIQAGILGEERKGPPTFWRPGNVVGPRRHRGVRRDVLLFAFTGQWPLTTGHSSLATRHSSHDLWGPPPMPRAELGIHGLNRWTVKCMKMVEKRRVHAAGNGPSEDRIIGSAMSWVSMA